ncbi:unnamed protein product [Citrullus colocynthis]|uniref:Uncharacterized protein n=1 Tax=Citrullus colocynthis TaxID=252529 RepID=A0ABP0XMC3_9ROSI
MRLSDDVDPLKVLKEGEATKTCAVSCLEKFHEATTDMKRKTKEMTLARAKGYEEIEVEEGSERRSVCLGRAPTYIGEESKMGLVRFVLLGHEAEVLGKASEREVLTIFVSLGCEVEVSGKASERGVPARSISLGREFDVSEKVSERGFQQDLSHWVVSERRVLVRLVSLGCGASGSWTAGLLRSGLGKDGLLTYSPGESSGVHLSTKDCLVLAVVEDDALALAVVDPVPSSLVMIEGIGDEGGQMGDFVLACRDSISYD